ncbi:MAG TPA: DUF6737 family protein [Allocoleopsis sp.]
MSTQQPLNPWSYKPWWCQPWSILLTGTAIIAGSWFLVKTLWVTIAIALPILVWWAFFLLLWPRLMIEYMSNQPNLSPSPDDSISRIGD